MVLPSWRCWWSLVQWLLVVDPVLLSVVKWVNHFWYKLVGFCYLKHRSSVFMSTAVIGSRENCEQATTCKSLETIHNTFVCSQDEAHFIIFKESLYSIWTEFDNVSCSIWISNKVRLDTELTIRIGRVTPEDITTSCCSTDETSCTTSRGLLIYSTYSRLTRVLPIPP